MKSNIFHIDSVAYGGSGVARGTDGKVCFIPRTLPGEIVEAEIVAEKKRFSSGRVLRIIEASAHRQNAECEYFAAHPCPGCAYMHCDYPYEIELKQQQLHDFLVRRSLISASQLLPPYASGSRTGNRNKLVLHTSGTARGYSSNDGRVLPVSSCRLAPPEINAFLAENPPRIL